MKCIFLFGSVLSSVAIAEFTTDRRSARDYDSVCASRTTNESGPAGHAAVQLSI